MAAVSANVIHHQSNHVKMQEQSDEDSNDGSLHSMGGEKNDASSPEYKPASPDRRVPNPFTVTSQDVMVPYQAVEPSGVPSDSETKSNQLHNSPFSMHNVLKMKQERDSVSPASVSCSNSGVFSTEKLLESTPSYVRQLSPRVEDVQENRIDYSPSSSRRESCSLDEDSPRKSDHDLKYRENLGSRERSRDDMDENSCCSEDTVLSVGNEAQMTNFDSENRTSSTANSQVLSPRSSPVPSPANHGLTSFKHIQSHLSAISQLSQNLHTGQHMLLRPNPIAPNPLLFLNQNRLLFNPHHPLQPPMPQVEQIHPNHQSLSNSPTNIVPPISRLSPNEISPNPNRSSSPGCEGKLNLMQNFAVLGQQAGFGQNLRYYKQIPFGTPAMHMGHIQGLSSGFVTNKTHDDIEGSRKSNPRERDKLVANNGSASINSSGINERLFGLVKANNTTHHLEDNLILNHNGLKFSIDNILKADFGRRITDPLHKRKSGSVKSKFTPTASPSAVNPSAPPKILKDSFKGGAFQSKEPTSNSFYKSQSANPTSVPAPLIGGSRLPDLKAAPLLQNNSVTSSVSGDKPAGTPIDLSKQDQQAASGDEKTGKDGPMVWPAWVYCTRYSDRPSSGPRTRRPKKPPGERSPGTREEEKRPRTAFSGPQLARLKHEFAENRYLTERRRQQLSAELGLNEAQIKIWFQNKRAKIKKASGQKNPLALQLMAQGLYNHSTVPLSREEEELQELHARETRDSN